MENILIEYENGDVAFFCPGCKCAHKVWVVDSSPGGSTWSWNEDMIKPTFSPSILVRSVNRKGNERVCHSFINDGMIQFLSDSSHELAGQTIPLKPFFK